MVSTFHAVMMRSEKNNASSKRTRLLLNFNALILREKESVRALRYNIDKLLKKQPKCTVK